MRGSIRKHEDGYKRTLVTLSTFVNSLKFTSAPKAVFHLKISSEKALSAFDLWLFFSSKPICHSYSPFAPENHGSWLVVYYLVEMLAWPYAINSPGKRKR